MIYVRERVAAIAILCVLCIAVWDYQHAEVSLHDATSDRKLSLEGSHTRTFHFSDRFLTITPLDGSAGRLGNFCFRYAAALGIAQRNNMTLILPDTQLVRTMADIFEITSPLTSDVPFIDAITFINMSEGHWGIYDTNFNKLPYGSIQLRWSYTQSWKYFYLVRQTVRKELQFKSHIRKQAEIMATRLRKTYAVKVVIGLHVRRGDFLIPNLQSWGYAVAPAYFFALATKFFVDSYGKNILFVVASDDLQWCRENINFNGAKSYFSNNRTAVEDFSLLAHTDHHIVSVGSFGWWAAWLGKGSVVYYKNFPTPGSAHSSNHNPVDYYPPDWFPLP